MRFSTIIRVLSGVAALSCAPLAVGQTETPPTPKGNVLSFSPSPLFFKEMWRIDGPPRALAVDLGSEHVLSNPNLELKVYGECGRDSDPNKRVWISGSSNDPVTNPTNIWMGMCTVPVVVTLRDKTHYVDLSGASRIRWLIKTGGFHDVRPVIKLADGTMLVGDHADSDPNTYLFTDHEFTFYGIRWLKLDPERIVTIGRLYTAAGETLWAPTPDLHRVDEVGFADLMPSSGHGAPGSSNVASFEVFGNSVPR